MHVQKCQFALDGVSFTRVLYNWEDDADFVKKNFQFDIIKELDEFWKFEKSGSSDL